MTVYASTAALAEPRELWQLLDLFRDEGVAAVELGFADLADATDLGGRLRSLPLRYLVHNYFPPPRESFVLNLGSPDAELRRKSIDLVFTALELAAEIGSPLYGVHAGWITDPIGWNGTSFILPDPGLGEADAARARFVDGIAAALRRAEELGVALLVENSVCTGDLRGKLLLLEAGDMAALFAELPGLGLLLDTGHLNVTARTLGFDRIAYVNTLSRHVRAWHVHDNDGLVDLHRPIEPSGWVDELLRRPALARLPVTVEAKFATVGELRTHVEWLETSR